MAGRNIPERASGTVWYLQNRSARYSRYRTIDNCSTDHALPVLSLSVRRTPRSCGATQDTGGRGLRHIRRNAGTDPTAERSESEEGDAKSKARRTQE